MAFPSIALDAIQDAHGKDLVLRTYILYCELFFIFYLIPLSTLYIYQGQELCLKYCLSVYTFQY